MLFVPFKKLHNQIAIIVRNVLCKDFIQILKFYDVQGGKKKKKKKAMFHHGGYSFIIDIPYSIENK